MARRTRVRNHCDLASPRTAPGWLLRELRQLDPAYDIHYLGNGVWVVGRVVDSRERKEIAGKIHRRRDRQESRGVRKFSQVALPILHMQGFGIVSTFEIQGEPDSRIIADIRKREWLYRTQREQEFLRRLDLSTREGEDPNVSMTGTDAWWADIEYREKNTKAYLFRGQKHFAQGNSHVGR